ncbi:MAG: glutamate ABC transporter substrate-binding protein [Actinomycetota bacterium]
MVSFVLPGRRARLLAVSTTIAMLVMVASWVVDTSSAGARDDVTSPTVAAVRARGELVVGTKFDQPLFGLRDPSTGSVEGFDVDIARIVARQVFGAKVARNLRFVETTSKTRETALTTGAVDLVAATYTITPAREEIVDFSRPYFTTGQTILTRRSDRSIRGVADLAGRTVCTVTGSTSATNLASAAPTAVPVLLDTYSACVAALDAGTVDAVTTDEGILLGFVARAPDAYRVVGPPFTTEYYGIGLPPGDPVLEQRVNAALARSFRDGSWTRAWKRTIGVTGAAPPRPPGGRN